MKKIRLLVIITLLGITSFVNAQEASVIVKGGLNLSNFYGKNLSGKNVKPGFHAGVGIDLEFVTNLSVQTGLYFTSKGAEFTTSILPHFENIIYNITTNYIQLPLHIAYKMQINNSSRLFFHAGPYIAYGISGKRIINNTEESLKSMAENWESYLKDKRIDTFDKELGHKRFDTGVGIGVGVEFESIVIDLGWDLGLKNIARKIDGLNTPNYKNQSAYLSVGYKF